MPKGISTKLVVEGESEYRASIAACRDELKTLQSELKLVESRYEENGASMEALQAKGEALAKVYDAQEKKLHTAQAALENAKEAQTTWNSKIEETRAALEKAEKKLVSYSDSTGDTADEQKELQEDLEALQKKLTEQENSAAAAGKAVNSWQREVNGAETELNKLQTELNRNAQAMEALADPAREAATGVEDIGEAAEEAAEEAQNLGDRGRQSLDIITTSIIASGIKDKFKDVCDAIIACTDAAAQFESALAKVSTLAGDATGQIREDLLALSSDTGQSVTALSDSLYQALSAGVDAENAVSFTGEATKLAVGGFTSASTAVDVLTTILNAYGLSMEETEAISSKLITTQNLGKTTVDELASSMGQVIPSAAAYNVNLDNLTAAYARMTASGVATAQSTTYIKSMLSELAKSGSNVSKILQEQTGKSFSSLMADGNSLGDVLQLLYTAAGSDATAFSNLWSSTEAGTGALTIVNSGVEAFNETLDAMANSSGTAQQAFDTISSTAEYSQQRLEVAAENLKIAVGEELAPALDRLRTAGANALTWATEFVQEHPGVVKALEVVTAGIVAVGAAATAAAVALKLIQIAQTFSPAAGIAIAITGIVAALGALATASGGAKVELSAVRQGLNETNANFAQQTSSINASAAVAARYAEELKALQAQSSLTTEEQARMQALVEKLNALMPELNLEIDEHTGKLREESAAVLDNVEALKQKYLIEAQQDYLRELYDGYAEAMRALTDAEVEQEAAQQSLAAAQIDQEDALLRIRECYTQYLESLGLATDGVANMTAEELEAATAGAMLGDEIDGLWDKYDDATDAVTDAADALDSCNDYVEAAQDDVDLMNESIDEATGLYGELTDSAEETADALSDTSAAAASQAAAVSDVKTAVDELCASYDEAKQAARDSIDQQIGLFEDMSTSVETDLGKVMSVLDEQVEDVDTYTQNLARAAELGLNEGLLQVLSDGTRQSEEYLAEILEGGADGVSLVNERFAEMQAETTTGVDDLIGALDSQAAYMDEYAANLQRAAELGIDEGLLKSLSDGSTESAEYLAAIVAGGEQGVADLNAAFRKVSEGKDAFAAQVAELETGVSEEMRQAVEDVEQAVQDMDLYPEAYKSGTHTMQGLMNGISSKTQELYRQMTVIAQQAMARYNAELDIQSPSRKMMESGANTLQGVIDGIESRQSELDDVMKEASQIVQDAFGDNEQARQMASDFADYYRQYMADVVDAASEAADAVQTELQSIQSQYEETLQAQEAMAQKLASYGELWSSRTINWTDGTSTTTTSLADLEAQTAYLERYGQVLESLRERGIDDGLMSEVLGMGVEEAVSYGELLLAQNDAQWDAYMAAYAEKQAAAQQIAEEFYRDQLTALETEYQQTLQSGLQELEGYGIDAGESTIRGLIAGMQAQEGALYAKAQSIANTVAATIRSALDIHSPSGVGKEIMQFFVKGMEVGVDDEVPALQNKVASSIPSAITEPLTQPLPSSGEIAAGVANAVGTLMAGGTGADGDLYVTLRIGESDTAFARAMIPAFRRVAAEQDLEVSV